MSAAPTFVCELTPGGGWRFFCPVCERFHYHGAAEGHRVAHCGGGPYREGGYYLAAPL